VYFSERNNSGGTGAVSTTKEEWWNLGKLNEEIL